MGCVISRYCTSIHYKRSAIFFNCAVLYSIIHDTNSAALNEMIIRYLSTGHLKYCIIFYKYSPTCINIITGSTTVFCD